MSLQELDQFEGGEIEERRSNRSLPSKKPGKYDHVESKVKKYRQEIQQQQTTRKKDKEKASSEEPLSSEAKLEKEIALIEILMNQNHQLMLEKSDLQLRLEALRRENDQLRNKEGLTFHNTLTSQSSLKLFQTPMRVISKTFLSPFQKRNDEESDEEDLAPVAKPRISLCSTVPLVLEDPPTQENRIKRLKDLILKYITCRNIKSNRIYWSTEDTTCNVNSQIPLVFLTGSQN